MVIITVMSLKDCEVFLTTVVVAVVVEMTMDIDTWNWQVNTDVQKSLRHAGLI